MPTNELLAEIDRLANALAERVATQTARAAIAERDAAIAELVVVLQFYAAGTANFEVKLLAEDWDYTTYGADNTAARKISFGERARAVLAKYAKEPK